MARVPGLLWVLLGGSLALACGANIASPAPAPDCAAGAGYDLSRIFYDPTMPAGDVGATPQGFNFGDSTPGATLTWGTIDVDPAQTCGRSRVLDMKSTGHNDYGSSFFFQLHGFDASGAAGIAFWAKAPEVVSDKSVNLLLDDRLSNAEAGVCFVAPPPPDAVLVPGAVGTPNGTNASNTPNYVPPAGSCGNLFQAPFQFTNQWQLYLVPFERFAQAMTPNRNPNGLDTSALYSFAIQVPKEAHFQIWIDQIGVYEPGPAGAGP
jgi:hypothetical protein